MATAATTASNGKLTAAMVLGIIGGVFGILGSLVAMLIGGMGAAFEAEGSGMLAGLGFAAFFLGVLGIVGGAMARSRPQAGAIMQLIAAVAGFIAVSAAWLLAGPLLLVGAIMAWLGRERATAADAPNAASTG